MFLSASLFARGEGDPPVRRPADGMRYRAALPGFL